jgi:hypothetical protein
MKKASWSRKGKTVINLVTGVVEEFKTINQAKKRSHQIQMEVDNGLGRGTVRRLSRNYSARLKAWRR